MNVVVFIFSRIPEPSFLLLKRSEEKGGFWQPVSGGVERNEDYIQAVKREIAEETGITDILNIVDLKMSYEYEATKNNVRMKMKDVCFGAEVIQTASVNLSDEHSNYKWCNREEVYTYLNWENIRLPFEQLIHSIEN